MSPPFLLDPRLKADTAAVGDLALCRVLLMNDARFPWIILVPRRAGLTEWFDLPAEEARLAHEETLRTARALKAMTGARKMNIAALGNMVAQLHIHVVARTAEDAAWPGPVWGVGTRVLYDLATLTERQKAVARALSISP